MCNASSNVRMPLATVGVLLTACSALRGQPAHRAPLRAFQKDEKAPCSANERKQRTKSSLSGSGRLSKKSC